jgi:integrase
MAYIEKRGDNFRIVFHLRGKRYRHALRTSDESVAKSVVGGVERTIMLVEQRALQIPEGADVITFILSAGQTAKTLARAEPAREPTKVETITLEQLRDKYVETMSIGAIEKNSLETVKMHLCHFGKTLGLRFMLQALTLTDLQDYVNKRAKAKGIRGRSLSPTTMQKEIASLRAAWNWGVQAGLLQGAFPNKGLKYPKTNEKPPFQTWKQIERQIGQGSLSPAEQQDLWDCLFLTMDEMNELLESIKDESVQRFLYPMCCFAAHTGARRSELTRIKIADIDLEAGTSRIHEKKRVHGKRTTRRVPLSASLMTVLQEWLAIHPGGPFLFSQQAAIIRSKKKRATACAVTRDEAHDHLKRALADTKWKVVRGWHLFRHCFISLCVTKGIDQRLIDSWVGHTTEEMRKRYSHLYPSAEREAIQVVFAN